MQNNRIFIALTSMVLLQFVVILFLLWMPKGNGNVSSDGNIYKSDTTINNYYNEVKGELQTHHYHHYHMDSIPYEVPVKVDTAAIIAQFYTEYIYSDTIADTNLTIYWRAKLLHNRIAESKLKYKIRAPVTEKIVTNFTDRPRPKLLVGIIAGTNFKFGSSNLSPTILFVTKNSCAISGGYDMVNKLYEIGAFIPIKK